MQKHVDIAASHLVPTRVVRHLRPLYFDANTLYCARFDHILATTDFGRSFTAVGTLRVEDRASQLGGMSPLLQRVLRAGVYRMRVLANGNRVYLFRKGIYTQLAGEQRATRTWAVREGSSPKSLAHRPGGWVVFGEYWGNPGRRDVHIHGSADHGLTWQPLYTFPAGSIRHVHGIAFDRWEDCFWICTGDDDHECRLVRASATFDALEVVAEGGQMQRFYSVLVGPEYLVLATDSPVEQNYIITFHKASGRFQRVQAIENTSFYSCQVGRRVFVSTNAEPSAVHDVRNSHVWMGEPGAPQWRRVLSFSVDAYERLSHLPGVPTGLFQYSRVFFPEGDNPSDTLVCHCIGLEGYDDAMVCYDLAAAGL